MSDNHELVLWAVSFRLGQLKERLKPMMESFDSCEKTKLRLQGNIGALEQVQRWMTGKEDMPQFGMSDQELMDRVDGPVGTPEGKNP